MLVLLVLFPIVMLEIRFLSPWLAGLNPPFATFVGNALSFTLVTWPMMPLAIRGLRWWLQPEAPHRPWITAAGLATVTALYALEIAVLWHFL